MVSGGMTVRDTNQSFSKQLVWGNISKPHHQEFDSFLDKLKEEKQLIAEQDNLLQSVRESHKKKEEKAS